MNWKLINKLAFCLFVASISLGQLTRLPLGMGGAIYAHDIILGGWLMVWLLSHQWRVKLTNFHWQQWWPELFWLGWVSLGWLAAAVSDTWQLETFLYTSRVIVYAVALYAMTTANGLSRLTLLTGWVSVGLFMLLFGFLQYVFIPDTRFLAILGWDDHYYRLIGTLFDPNFTGMVFVLTIIYLQRMRKAKTPSWSRHIISFLQATLVIGIALTFSRASYLTLLFSGVGIVGILLSQQPKKWLTYLGISLIYLATGLGALYLAPKPGGEGVQLLRTASLTARVEASQSTIETDWRTLIVGEGLFQPQVPATTTEGFERPQTARFADNFWLFLYNGTGVVGLAIAVGLLSKWGLWLWRQDQLIALAVGSVLIHSFFNNTLLQPFILILTLGGIFWAFKSGK